MSERLMSGKLALSVAALLLAAFGAFAGEATYPDRPITMIVTFPAGGASDVLARASADALSRGLGQPVVVDNRPGAGGHIGAEFVAHAAPDGYTILFGTNGTLGIGPALYKNLRYDPQRDLAPIGILHKLPLLLIVHPSIPAKTLPELIDYARQNPGKLSFASAGVGTVSHLAGELFKREADIDILHVPYKGDGATFPDLLAGRVSMMLGTIPTALPLAQSGQMRAIGVTTEERSPSAPDIPTLARIRPAAVRCERMDRLVRSRGHASADHRTPERRNAKNCGGQGLHRCDQIDGDRRHQLDPGSVRRFRARGRRAMDQSHSKRRYRANRVRSPQRTHD